MNRSGLIVLVAIILLAVGWFYWWEWRPAHTRELCHNGAEEEAAEFLKKKVEMEGGWQFREPAQEGLFLRGDYEAIYIRCLRAHGLTE